MTDEGSLIPWLYLLCHATRTLLEIGKDEYGTYLVWKPVEEEPGQRTITFRSSWDAYYLKEAR